MPIFNYNTVQNALQIVPYLIVRIVHQALPKWRMPLISMTANLTQLSSSIATIHMRPSKCNNVGDKSCNESYFHSSIIWQLVRYAVNSIWFFEPDAIIVYTSSCTALLYRKCAQTNCPLVGMGVRFLLPSYLISIWFLCRSILCAYFSTSQSHL